MLLILILIFIYILLKIFYPQITGYIGEFHVKSLLKKLPKKEYIVLNDIMLENNYGTHQIDHLIISKYGIFVIEMKNYYGLIIGEDYKENWIQCLGRKKYYFKNPINQNYSHVKTIEELLKLDNSFFIPIVCFSNSAKLRVKSKNIVVKLNHLVETIEKFYKPLLENDINELAHIIIENNIIDKEKRKEHVRKIKNKIKENNVKAENMTCPKCGNPLVLKNSRYGTFKGCSTFPKCRYTKK